MSRNEAKFRTFFTRHRAVILFFVLCILALIAITLTMATPTLSRPGTGVVAGGQRLFYTVGSFFGNTFGAVRKLKQIERERDTLIRRLQEYDRLESDTTALREEVFRLRQLLGFANHIQYSTVAARVIGKDPGNLFDTITINKGSEDDVREHMPVVALENGEQVLVGKVRRVSRRTALVEPIFDVNSFVASRLTSSRFEGLIQGSGEAIKPLIMSYVDVRRRNLISYGDRVETSGLGSIYPGGIVIGTISEIISKSYELSLQLGVEAAIDFSRLEYVFVVDYSNDAAEILWED